MVPRDHRKVRVIESEWFMIQGDLGIWYDHMRSFLSISAWMSTGCLSSDAVINEVKLEHSDERTTGTHMAS